MAPEANLAGVHSPTVKAAPGSLIAPLETDLAAVRGLVVEAPLAFALAFGLVLSAFGRGRLLPSPWWMLAASRL